MVATDIASRGLDVETISHVINYDIPDTADTYIHRIGRTGRAEREGDAMTLITREDTAVVWDIEKTLGGPIERRKLEDFNYETPAPPKEESSRSQMPRRFPKPAANKPRSFARSGRRS
jgi:ATP-dependent RNA helicase RhlE